MTPKDHWVTLPRASRERDLLLAVRRGEWPEERVIRHANRLMISLQKSAEASSLPEKVDLIVVSKLVSEIYLQHWGRFQVTHPRDSKEKPRTCKTGPRQPAACIFLITNTPSVREGHLH